MNIQTNCLQAGFANNLVDFKLEKAIRERVKKIILIGEAKEKIARALNNTGPSESVASLKEAVRAGYSEARPGEVILLQGIFYVIKPVFIS